MSGFAAVTGEPDGPPTLPPFGLADGITALATAYAVLVALRERDRSAAGQVIDMAIIEPILVMLGGRSRRTSSSAMSSRDWATARSNNAPRNVYRTADGRWVAVSTSSQSIAERVVALVGRPDCSRSRGSGPGGRGRARGRAGRRRRILDRARALDEVMAAFEKAEAAVGRCTTSAGS